jgi:FkbM family methyltransferase
MRSLRKRFRYLTDARTVTIDGVRIVSDKARIPEQLRALLYREVYEDTERNLLLRVLSPGMKVLEIGTGIGFISLLSTRLCGEGNVLSYEANGSLEPMIRENYGLNGLRPNLKMRAVTADGQPIRFFRNDNIISSSVYDRKMDAQEVVVESDAFGAVIADFNPDVLIMDVEGAEVDLFQSVDLGRIRHIVVELHPHIVGEDKIAAVVARLKGQGFAVRQQDRKTSHFERAAQ